MICRQSRVKPPRERSKDSKQEDVLQGCRKLDSSLTDSSATAPETPAASDPKPHVSFQGYEDERPVESKERHGNSNGKEQHGDPSGKERQENPTGKERQEHLNDKERQGNPNGSQQVSALTQANVSAFAAHKDGEQVRIDSLSVVGPPCSISMLRWKHLMYSGFRASGLF